MFETKKLGCGVLLVLLAACGGSGGGSVTTTPTTPTTPTTSSVGSAAVQGGVYSVTTNGATTTLPSGAYTLNGQKAWATGDVRANAYEDANVLAIGGLNNGTPFAGVTGTTGTAPTTGTATYTGRYAVNTETTQRSGALVLNADFAAGTVSDSTDAIDVAGTISGSAISGTVTYNGESGDLAGGFYGTDTVAGAFAGDKIGGVIFGTKN